MTCKYCGRTISDGSTSCPFCGSSASLYSEPFEENEDSVVDSEYPAEDEVSYGRKKRTGFKMPKVSMPKSSGASFSMPKVNLNVSTVISFICALFSLVCLMRVSALSSALKEHDSVAKANLTQIHSAITALDDRLSALDTTVANVQTNAYNQYASQAITISKDLSSLTGPVTAGKYNQMFIVNAKGNLNLNTSFDWQKYNDYNKTWVSIPFSGTATSNEEYGLRIENSYDSSSSTYVSILWANGITPAAAGTYRCVITDINGLTNTSSEAVVSVSNG